MADAASTRGEGVEGGQGGVAWAFPCPYRRHVEVVELDQADLED
jgi:hypothetical protein